MLTMVISKDEERLKSLLTDALKREGYDVMNEDIPGRIVKVVKRDAVYDPATLKDQIVGLLDSWYTQKRGQLYKSILDAVEAPLIEYVLAQTSGNQLKAARVLGINRNTMRSKIKRLGIDADQWKTA
jgi:DNA-binding protein Fis